MSRSSPPDTSKKSLDEDIRALIEDIDASMADFERRLETAHLRQQRPARAERIPTPVPKIGSPKPAQPAPPESSSATVSTPPEPTPATAPPEPAPASSPATAPTAPPAITGSLLAELEAEIQGKSSDQAQQAATNRRIHEALDRVFRFFDVFCRHANALAPAVKRSYRLDAQVSYDDLRWQEAIVKTRREGLSEKALIDFVAFRVRLAAPAPLTVTVGWNRLAAFKKDMDILDLRTAEGMDHDGVVEQGELVMRLAPDFPVQLTFGANYESGRVEVLSRNLEGFGIAAFTCAPDDITQDFLDGLGRFLLARDNHLPAALRRVHHRAEL